MKKEAPDRPSLFESLQVLRAESTLKMHKNKNVEYAKGYVAGIEAAISLIVKSGIEE
jgi:hypothetical protein